MGKKISRYKDGNGNIGYHFHCPGCNSAHGVFIKGVGVPIWGFNENEELPTFSPSILVRWTYGKENKNMICHSFVRDGKIQFLNDCTHDLKGQTVELDDF